MAHSNGSESFELINHDRDQLDMPVTRFDLLYEKYQDQTFACQSLSISRVNNRSFVDCIFTNLIELTLGQADSNSFVRCKFPRLTHLILDQPSLDLVRPKDDHSGVIFSKEYLFSGCDFDSWPDPVGIKYLSEPIMVEQYNPEDPTQQMDSEIRDSPLEPNSDHIDDNEPPLIDPLFKEDQISENSSNSDSDSDSKKSSLLQKSSTSSSSSFGPNLTKLRFKEDPSSDPISPSIFTLAGSLAGMIVVRGLRTVFDN